MNIQKLSFLRVGTPNLIQLCGVKYYPPPPNYDHIDKSFFEKPKLRFVDKAPIIPPGQKAIKMQKKLRLMRGPETVHNFLQHKQYGIMALGGGRLKINHFEMMRLNLGRNMDISRMFAVWRVDAPWQPVTEKGAGHRMGGGKDSIEFYVTPIKAGRIILELGGKCEYAEVENILTNIANKLPFKAMAVSQQILEKRMLKEEFEKKYNQNKYTMKYMMQNNMGGCQSWMSPFDYKFLGKYM